MVQNLILPTRARAEVEVAVTNSNDVAFEIDTDNDSNPLPTGMRVTGVSVIPHNAADPPVAVSTVWRLYLYNKYTKLIDEIVYPDSRFTFPASSEPALNATEWQYDNKDGVGAIYGTIGIENGANDCSFTIAIDFERSR